MLSPEYGTSLIRADASNRPIIIPMAKERTKSSGPDASNNLTIRKTTTSFPSVW